MIKIIFLTTSFFVISCTSDEITKNEAKDFFGVYKNVVKAIRAEEVQENFLAKTKKTSKWLSKFNQPIILIASNNEKVQATLVALGNNKERLTWVSSDGISLSYDNGILIATRGFTRDLMSLNHPNLRRVFRNLNKPYFKTHRFLDSTNQDEDIKFTCVMKKKSDPRLSILEYKISTTHIIENCESNYQSYTNEYYLLPETDIVLKSKQWISPINGSFITYNYYAFQKK